VRLLADENIPLASIQALRAAGHDVLSATEAMSHAEDREVLDRAGAEQRVLVTFDRDFGALAFRYQASAPAGIVLLRFVPVTPDEPAAILADLLSDPALGFSGKFTVVDRERVRQRSLKREGRDA
jgi:predicted nuclease of predicted toxin-antitoxin system